MNKIIKNVKVALEPPDEISCVNKSGVVLKKYGNPHQWSAIILLFIAIFLLFF